MLQGNALACLFLAQALVKNEVNYWRTPLALLYHLPAYLYRVVLEVYAPKSKIACSGLRTWLVMIPGGLHHLLQNNKKNLLNHVTGS